MKICVICGKEYSGYGNNPEPLARYKDGQCCDECDCLKVIPARLGNSELGKSVGEMELTHRNWWKKNRNATMEQFMAAVAAGEITKKS